MRAIEGRRPSGAPVVTVVLLTYNHAMFISEAVESVLAQVTEFPIELVVIDDCSTDGTRDILSSYRERFPDVIRLVLADTNQNDNRAWGEAILTARGRYVALLDGDDYWTSPDKLARQVAFLEANRRCTICFHNARVVWSDHPELDHDYNGSTQAEVSTIEPLWARNFMATGSIMLRGGLIQRVPEWFVGMRFGDWPLSLLFAEQGDIGYLPEVMSVYRRHRGGLFGGLTSVEQIQESLRFYEDIRPQFDRRHDSAIQAAVFSHQCQLVQAHLNIQDRAGAMRAFRELLRSGGHGPVERWKQILRLAMALLFRRPVPSGVASS